MQMTAPAPLSVPEKGQAATGMAGKATTLAGFQTGYRSFTCRKYTNSWGIGKE
jgi:hypothetical protein